MKKTVQTPWSAMRSNGGRDSWIGSIDFTKNLSIWKVLTMLMFLLCFANGLCLHFVFSRLPWQYQKLASAGKPYIDTENTDFTGGGYGCCNRWDVHLLRLWLAVHHQGAG